MRHSPTYTISNIYLDKQQTPPRIDCKLSGNYLVFWWKEIALGQLLIEPGHQLTEETYYEKLIEAIKPAIKPYAAESENDKWQSHLQNKCFSQWTDWMENAFSSDTNHEIPASVPVSVVICTHNRAHLLKRCLESLHQLRCLPQEIIVIDNAPADNSTQYVVSEFDNVIYVKEHLPGLSHARNTGVLFVTKPIMACLDDDALVHPDWVYRVWQTFSNSQTVAMTGLVIASELQTEAQQIFEKHWSFNRGFVDRIYDKQYFNATLSIGPPVWEIGAGANMAFRKSIFEEVGRFNTALGAGASGCSEDSELWYRILMSGHTIHYNPKAIVYHEHRRELKGLKKQIYYYMRGFTTAVLLQQNQCPKAGYKKHLYQILPKYYLDQIKKGFPLYRSKFSTVWVEVRGMLAGLFLYYKNQRRFTKLSRK